MGESTRPTTIPSTTTPGATKIVKLGESTLMITEINNATDVPEGEYRIQQISVLGPTHPMGPVSRALESPDDTTEAIEICGAQCEERCTIQF